MAGLVVVNTGIARNARAQLADDLKVGENIWQRLLAQRAARLTVGASVLTADFGGEVPATIEELQRLPGVGRKTANVVLNVAFGEATMAVDTHVFRVANRTGLAPGRNPLQVEAGLLRRVPALYSVDAHHWLILHGRYVCQARKPLCERCSVVAWCDLGHKLGQKSAHLQS